MFTALPSFGMQDGFKKLTLEIPEEFHDKLRRFCFENGTNMKQIVSDLLAEKLRLPKPKFVDRRKLTRAEREKMEAAQARKK